MKKYALQGYGALQFSQNSKMAKTVLMKALLNNLDDHSHSHSREAHLSISVLFLLRACIYFPLTQKIYRKEECILLTILPFYESIMLGRFHLYHSTLRRNKSDLVLFHLCPYMRSK